jgi:hypothetical protein
LRGQVRCVACARRAQRLRIETRWSLGTPRDRLIEAGRSARLIERAGTGAAQPG